jgi:beta-glucosidase
MKLEFPKEFYWGAATSSHQVEGGNYDDWTEWEMKNAKIKSQNAQLRSWPDYILNKYPNPLQEENYISGRACDHYHKFEEDFNVAQSLGHNAHRFSIEWSRIEPEEGKFNEKEIAHYQRVVNSLHQHGLEPFVTLWHWTIPVWFRDKGGWLNKDASKYFERYVEKVLRSLKAVKFWITLNEPNVYTICSFLNGSWPPQNKSIFKYFKVLKNLARAHKNAYKIIKETDPAARVGIAKNNSYFKNIPGGNYFRNQYFLRKIKKEQDFIGLNYYKSLLFPKKDLPLSDLGWRIYPKGIYYVLKDLKKYNLPVYVTENGLADVRDEKREKFIKDHLRWIHQAIQGGVDVRGYFYWSLLDNFEWDKGFWPRFGLVAIDYRTMERKIRQSALEYTKICKSNTLETE